MSFFMAAVLERRKMSKMKIGGRPWKARGVMTSLRIERHVKVFVQLDLHGPLDSMGIGTNRSRVISAA